MQTRNFHDLRVDRRYAKPSHPCSEPNPGKYHRGLKTETAAHRALQHPRMPNARAATQPERLLGRIAFRGIARPETEPDHHVKRRFLLRGPLFVRQSINEPPLRRSGAQ